MADPQPPDKAVAAHRLSTARLYFILFVFLVASGYAVWKSDRFQSLVQGVSQSRLSAALGVPVSFDTVDVSFLPPSVILANVRIGNDPKLHLPEDQPVLTVEEISVGGGVSLVGSTLRLGRIRALRPHVHLVQSPEGVLNVPPGLGGPSSGGGLQIWIGSVLIQQGVFEFEGHKAAIDGRFEDFTTDVSRTVRDRYRGTLTARRASLTLARAEPLEMSLAVRFLIDPRAGIRFDDLSVSGRFGQLRVAGSLEPLRQPTALFTGSGQVVLEEVERVFHSPLGFSGLAKVQATVEVPPAGGFRIGGSIQAAKVRRDTFVFEDVVAQVAAQPELLVAEIQHGGYSGGHASGVLRIANLVGHTQPMTLALEGRDISVERFFEDLGLPGTGLSGGADLSVALRWGEAGLDRADGGGSIAFRAGPAASLVRGRFGIPVGGGGPFAVTDGRIRFIGAQLKFPQSTVDLDGGFRIGRWKPDFDLQIRSQDDSELDRLFWNLTAATGGKPELLGLGGSGQIQGHLSGEWGNPDATFQLALENARYANIPFGSVRGTVEMRDGAFFFRPLRVYEADESFSLEGMARYRPQPNRPRFDLSVSAHRFPLSRFLEYLDLKYPVDGLASGSFPVTGTPNEVTGGGRFQLEEATVWGQKVPLLRGNIQFTPGSVALEDVSAEVGEGMIRGSGSIRMEDKTFQVRAAGDKIAFAEIQAAQSISSDIAGKISFQVAGGGSLDRPDLKLSASLSEAIFFGHAVPEQWEPSADVTLQHGVMTAAVQVPSHWSLKAHGDLFGSPAKIDLALDAPDLAALADLTPLDLRPGEGGSFAFEGSLTLPAHSGDFPSGEGAVTRAQLDLPDRPAVISASEPVRLSFADGKLTVHEFGAAGEGTSIRLGGQVDLGTTPHGLSLAAKGTMDASAIDVLVPDLSLQGKITVDARASGTFDQPALSGTLRMEKGKYRLSGMGAVVDDVDATVTFHESRGDISARSKYGGGELQASGSFSVQGLSLKEFRVSVQGRHVRLPTFQDFRVVADADLVATGGPSGNTIRGEVVLLRVNYSKDFDITLSDLMARSRPAGAGLVEPWKQNTKIEIHIVSSESLEVRNNVARLTGTVDLIARGTVADPSLNGQIVLDEGGRLTFRNVRYDIESGVVTFASARGFVPILDIHARAEVKGYDLGVGLVGTWPRIQASFTSDPPLPDETIFALLLTGSTGSTTSGQPTDTGSSIVSVGAGIAAGAVTGGITRGTQKVLKLERFEIDPIFSGGQLTDVRSTIGKQITPDILFTYSQSFETTKVPIVQVEWRISDTVILLAQKDENGIYRIDVRKRKSF